MVVAGLCLLLISFIKDSPALPIPSNFYGDHLNVYYGAEPSVLTSDSSAVISKLTSSIATTLLTSTAIADWD